MSTVVSTLPARPPIPASALPNGGSRELAEDVFQTAEEAVLAQDALPVTGEAEPGHSARNRPFMSAVRSHVAARPCQAVLLAAAAGALAMLILRQRLRGRFTLRPYT